MNGASMPEILAALAREALAEGIDPEALAGRIADGVRNAMRTQLAQREMVIEIRISHTNSAQARAGLVDRITEMLCDYERTSIDWRDEDRAAKSTPAPVGGIATAAAPVIQAAPPEAHAPHITADPIRRALNESRDAWDGDPVKATAAAYRAAARAAHAAGVLNDGQLEEIMIDTAPAFL